MKNDTITPTRPNRYFPALIAVGSSLAALPVSALELGDMTVNSSLGQPLRASIAYALAPNERLLNSCVTLRPGASSSGLPNIGRATLSVADGIIRLTGSTPIREPMVSALVMVNCPYTANISREYTLLIDPAIPAYQQPEAIQQTVTRVAVASDSAVTNSRPAKRATSVQPEVTLTKNVAIETQYRVRPGDSLSEIAQRIENRPIGLWFAVTEIFEANPSAFVDNDPNKLIAGSVLSIPSFDGNAPAEFGDSAVATQVTAATDSESDSAPTSTVESSAAESSATSITTDDISTDASANAIEPESTVNMEAIVIPDTRLEGPTTTSISPNVPTAIIETRIDAVTGPIEETKSYSWLLWLAGSGIAIFIGLMLFGRQARSRLTPAPEQTVAMPRPKIAADIEVTTETEAAVEVDYDLTSETPTTENLALDADLTIGTGLENNAGMHFDFAHSSEGDQDNDMDFELPFEPMAEVKVEAAASEVSSTEDAGENDESMPTDAYTIDQAADFHILAQDYEDEMTATQLLNKEVQQAAADLTENLDENQASNETTENQLATVVEIDVTAQFSASNDEIGDTDDTGVNEAITVNISADDKTVEMPSADSEADTMEMPAKSGNTG